MATQKVYDACCRKIQMYGLHSLNSKGTSFRMSKPDMKKLFGEKLIVNDSQMACCSEAEKSRHLYEDRVLRFLYLEDQSYDRLPVKK